MRAAGKEGKLKGSQKRRRASSIIRQRWVGPQLRSPRTKEEEKKHVKE